MLTNETARAKTTHAATMRARCDNATRWKKEIEKASEKKKAKKEVDGRSRRRVYLSGCGTWATQAAADDNTYFEYSLFRFFVNNMLYKYREG